jgi:hypothetical protein
LFENSTQSGLFSPGVGGQVHLLAIADAISTHLNGELLIDGHFSTLTSTTLLTETSIFEPYNIETLAQVHSANPGMNTTAGVTNISQGEISERSSFVSQLMVDDFSLAGSRCECDPG